MIFLKPAESPAQLLPSWLVAIFYDFYFYDQKADSYFPLVNLLSLTPPVDDATCHPPPANYTFFVVYSRFSSISSLPIHLSSPCRYISAIFDPPPVDNSFGLPMTRRVPPPRGRVPRGARRVLWGISLVIGIAACGVPCGVYRGVAREGGGATSRGGGMIIFRC